MKTTLHVNTAARERPLKIKGRWVPVFSKTDYHFFVRDYRQGVIENERIEIMLFEEKVYECRSAEFIDFVTTHTSPSYKFPRVTEQTLSLFLEHLQMQGKIPTPTEVLIDF